MAEEVRRYYEGIGRRKSASARVRIIDLLHELRERFEVTYLVISHDLSIIRHLCFCEIDLIIECHFLFIQVFHSDPAGFAEGHDPVAVESASRIHTHWQG